MKPVRAKIQQVPRHCPRLGEELILSGECFFHTFETPRQVGLPREHLYARIHVYLLVWKQLGEKLWCDILIVPGDVPSRGQLPPTLSVADGSFVILLVVFESEIQNSTRHFLHQGKAGLSNINSEAALLVFLGEGAIRIIFGAKDLLSNFLPKLVLIKSYMRILASGSVPQFFLLFLLPGRVVRETGPLVHYLIVLVELLGVVDMVFNVSCCVDLRCDIQHVLVNFLLCTLIVLLLCQLCN